VEALFNQDWYPASIVRTRPLTVVFDGYDGEEQMYDSDVRALEVNSRSKHLANTSKLKMIESEDKLKRFTFAPI